MDAPSAETVAKAISIFYANPKADQEAILRALDSAGIPPREAWELYQFLPIAFVHVAFRDQGVDFTPDYELDAAGSSARTRHKFADEPIYVAGVTAAEGALADGHTALELRPVFRHSAEYGVILKLVRPDGSMDGIALPSPSCSNTKSDGGIPASDDPNRATLHQLVMGVRSCVPLQPLRSATAFAQACTTIELSFSGT